MDKVRYSKLPQTDQYSSAVSAEQDWTWNECDMNKQNDALNNVTFQQFANKKQWLHC